MDFSVKYQADPEVIFTSTKMDEGFVTALQQKGDICSNVIHSLEVRKESVPACWQVSSIASLPADLHYGVYVHRLDFGLRFESINVENSCQEFVGKFGDDSSPD